MKHDSETTFDQRIKRYRDSINGRDRLILDMNAAGYNKSEISRRLGIGRPTVYRVLNPRGSRG